jgi:hypothetical protein
VGGPEGDDGDAPARRTWEHDVITSSARGASPSGPLGQGARQIHLPELLFQPRHGLEAETAEAARDLVLPTEWQDGDKEQCKVF